RSGESGLCQLAALEADQAEARGAGLAAVERDGQRLVAAALHRADEMVAIEPERRALDMVEGARREDERSARTIDLLADLTGLLPVGVQVLQREGELAIDM